MRLSESMWRLGRVWRNKKLKTRELKPFHLFQLRNGYQNIYSLCRPRRETVRDLREQGQK